MYRYACWDNQKKCIILFTWDENGQRITREMPFKPYFYIEDSRGKAKSIFGTPLIKREFNTPFERNKFIEDSHLTRLFENLKPAQQFLIEQYEGLQDDPSFLKNPLKIYMYDIETKPLPFNEFPKPEEAKAEISLITIHNSLLDEYTTFGTSVFHGKFPSDLKVKYVYCQTEADLLENFLQFLEKDHPDILSGWNSDMFDMPYIVNRITKVLGEEQLVRLSPIGKFRATIGKTKDNPPREYTKYITDGMLNVDYMNVYKKFKVKLQENYKLDHIGEIETGQKKLEYEGNIGEFQTRDWDTFVLYNIRDVELLVNIDKKTNYFASFRSLGIMGLTNFEDSLGVQVYSVGALCLRAHTKGQIMYTPIRKVETGKNEGGYVSCNPGLTRDLFTLDFSSLYPNVIITANISPETMVGRFEEYDNEIVVTRTSGKQYKLTKEKFDEFVKKNNLIKSKANVLFRQDKIGIIPEHMADFFARRKQVRKNLFEKEQILGNILKRIQELEDETDISKH